MTLYIIMFVFVGLMLVGAKQYARTRVLGWRRLAVLSSLCAMAMAGIRMIWGGAPEPKLALNTASVERRYFDARAEIAGRMMAKKFPGEGPVVLLYPYVSDNNKDGLKRRESTIHSLEKGFGTKLTLEGWESLNIDEQTATTEDYMLTVDDVDGWIANHENAGIIVSMVGLPENYRDLQLWRMDPDIRPKLILFDLPPQFSDMIRAGYIAGAVVMRPDFRLDYDAVRGKDLSRDPAVLFAQRFLWVDADNIAELSEKYPAALAPVD